MTEKVTQCSVKGCKDAAVTKGMCPRHYQRFRMHGDATAPSKRDKLTPEQVVAIRAVENYRGVNVALAAKYHVTESTISSIRRGDRRPESKADRAKARAAAAKRSAKAPKAAKPKKAKAVKRGGKSEKVAKAIKAIKARAGKTAAPAAAA